MTPQFHHPTFAVTVDMALFGFAHDVLSILLVQRKYSPYAGHWALPGGFVDPDEDLTTAVIRELHEESGLTPAWCTQLHTYGTPGRDPRRRTISVAHLGICQGTPPVICSDETPIVAWHPLDHLPVLAFDHDHMVLAAKHMLVHGCHDLALLSRFFPETFTLSDFHRLVSTLHQCDIPAAPFMAALQAHPALEQLDDDALHGRYRCIATNYVPFVWTS
jgi:8-oxo-dGTP diphosphatase